MSEIVRFTSAPLFELRGALFVDEDTAKVVKQGSRVKIVVSEANREIQISGTVQGVSELASMGIYVIQVV